MVGSILGNDRGYATVVGVGFISALISVAGALGLGAQLLCDAAQAQVAADMAAISGAYALVAGHDACAAAAFLAEANQAQLQQCDLRKGDVVVSVEVGAQQRRSKAGPLP